MAKVTFSRNDIESLCDRLDAKAWSRLMVDMPELQRDLRSASGILRWYTAMGVPITPIQIEIVNGGLNGQEN